MRVAMLPDSVMVASRGGTTADSSGNGGRSTKTKKEKGKGNKNSKVSKKKDKSSRRDGGSPSSASSSAVPGKEIRPVLLLCPYASTIHSNPCMTKNFVQTG